MERAAWQVTVYGAIRVRHDGVTKHSTAPVLEALENPLWSACAAVVMGAVYFYLLIQ